MKNFKINLLYLNWLIFYLLLHLTAIAQSNLSNLSEKNEVQYILWDSDYRLTWSDFKSVDNVEGEFAAISWTLIKPSKIGLDENEMLFTIETYFVKDSSIVESDHRTNELLHHEQLHWDIAELFARKLRKIYATHTSENIAKSYKYFNQEYNKMLDDKRIMQSLYDNETDRSRNTEKQKEWEIKITKFLDDYSAFTDTRVIVKRILETK